MEGAELSIGGAEGHPKSIQIDTSELRGRKKPIRDRQGTVDGAWRALYGEKGADWSGRR